MQSPARKSKFWHLWSTLCVLMLGMGSAKPAQANWFEYWASGEMGLDLLGVIGVSEDDLADIVNDVGDAVDDLSKKTENTIKQIKGDCFEGVTFMDDLDAVANELEFFWEYKGVIAEGFVEGLADDFTSGRARDRIIAYGKGLGEGVYEAGKETLFLAADGISYGVLVTFTDGDEEYLEYYSQIASAYNDAAKNGIHHGEVTGQLLEGLVGIPGRVADDLANDNPEGLGYTIGSFIPPAKVVKLTTKGGTAATQRILAGTRATTRTAPKVTVVTRTGTHALPGRVVGQYNALKRHPKLGVPQSGYRVTQSDQANFAGYRVTDVKLSEPLTLHRYHNNQAPSRVWNPDTVRWETRPGAGEWGAYWSLGEPAGPGVARVDSAVLPHWGNTMTHRTTVQVPAGTVLSVGEAAHQGSYFVGGGSQVYLKGIKSVVERGGQVVERIEMAPSP